MPKNHEKITEDNQHIIKDHKIYKPNNTVAKWSTQIISFPSDRITLLFCKIHNSSTIIDMNANLIRKDSKDFELKFRH